MQPLTPLQQKLFDVMEIHDLDQLEQDAIAAEIATMNAVDLRANIKAWQESSAFIKACERACARRR